MRISLLLCLFIPLSLTALSQTYNGGGGAIPDDGSSFLDIPITVSGLAVPTMSNGYGVETVCLNIQHTYDGDLNISLIAPDGAQVMLASHNGGADDDFTNACFNKQSPNPIASGNAPFTGTWKPAGNLGSVNNGQNGNGIWKLRVFDDYPSDNGNVISWNITFGNNPASFTPFTSSNLPLVIINTNSQPIPNDPKIMAGMGIIYNGPGNLNHTTDPFNHYNGKIGIETRGASSSNFPKQSYGFETWTNSGNDTNRSLLGMPLESDWILSANYTDKSLMNNVYAYEVFRSTGLYAPRTKFVELILNGQYQGVYILTEKIKRDSNRVSVSKLTASDTIGEPLTGGYIVKIDKVNGGGGDGWTSPYPPYLDNQNHTIFFQYDYPKDVDIKPQQQAYIQRYVDSFENALHNLPLYDLNNGWRKYADEFSFIRFFILNELSRNVDGYRISTFLYKAKRSKGGKLFVGPPWDYDIAFGNADYCDGFADTGWAYRYGSVCADDFYQVPFWWDKMLQDTTFQNNLKCIYDDMRETILDTGYISHYLDSTAAVLSAAQARNFEQWPILGTYVWPNPSPIPASYAGEVAELKQWLFKRITWLDANIPGKCYNLSASEVALNTSCNAYPNPFSDGFMLEMNTPKAGRLMLQMLTMDGRVVHTGELRTVSGKNVFSIETPAALPPGVYMLSLQNGVELSSLKVIKR
jgi:subtilisin-like proprotein convertase family protein